MKKKKQSPENAESIRRWRLVLGPFGEDPLLSEPERGLPGTETARVERSQSVLAREDSRRDRLLHYLYGREYQKRETRAGGRVGRDLSGTTPSSWLAEVRRLFPRSTSEILQREALDRYGLAELLADPAVLEKAEPSMDLVKNLMAFRSLLPKESMKAARKIIRQVVEELAKRLSKKVINAIQGPRKRNAGSGRPSLSNLDWKTTILRNLRHYNREEQALVLERLYFFERNNRRIPWDIEIIVDQSGSMLNSVIHSAVLAFIFHGLSCLRTRLILFDDRVVDLTGKIDDPVDVLLGATLGGGTDIGNAMNYAASCVRNPGRTMIVLITDFYEGGRLEVLETVVSRLNDSGATLLGLAALDERAEPDFDRTVARRLAGLGMEIAAMTPDRLAEWVSSIINR